VDVHEGKFEIASLASLRSLQRNQKFEKNEWWMRAVRHASALPMQKN